MTEEEKEYFIIALCSYLPYGLKIQGVNDRSDIIETLGGWINGETLDFFIEEEEGWFSVEDIKPYLRTLTSMTVAETEEYHMLQKPHKLHNSFGLNYYCYYDTAESIDWLNKHFFDYRELIDKGFAMPAPKYIYAS